jgi:hypothetical protein
LNMNWYCRWTPLSLAAQFSIAGGLVCLAAMFVAGFLITSLIENAVIHNSGAATALYVDSVVAPLLPDMQKEALLDEASALALDETLGQGALGRRLVSFKLWRGDGTILYSNDKNLVGRTYPVSSKLRQAFAGSLIARYEDANDPESSVERALGKPLMEIYNPVLQPWSGQAVAVLEFYETADGLGETLARARLSSWLAVVGLASIFFLVLSALVFRGSRTIEHQRRDLAARVEDLSALLTENQDPATATTAGITARCVTERDILAKYRSRPARRAGSTHCLCLTEAGQRIAHQPRHPSGGARKGAFLDPLELGRGHG